MSKACKCVPAVSQRMTARPTPRTEDDGNATTKHVLVGEHLVGYTDVGAGTPVILVHGSASSREQWRPLTKRLEDRYRVIAVDLHGYGSTRALSAKEHVRIHHDVAIVTTLAQSLGEPVHLVGHAYGGIVCLEAALELPSRVLSLSLYEPAAVHLLRDAQDQTGWMEIAELAERHIELTWEGDLNSSAEMFVNYLWGANAWSILPRDARNSIARHMPKVASEWLLALETHWERDRYSQLDVPTLLMRGTRTPKAAKQIVEELLGNVPNSTLVEIAGAAHMAPMTHTFAVNDVIDTHLWKHSPISGSMCQ